MMKKTRLKTCSNSRMTTATTVSPGVHPTLRQCLTCQWLYHIASVAQHTDIQTSLDSARSQQIAENRLRLKPIISTIILCGRQSIALRGHGDDGTLPVPSDDAAGPVTNEGNFRALLLYRIDGGDSVLENHLQTTGKNATYISNTTQNDPITSAGSVIREKNTY